MAKKNKLYRQGDVLVVEMNNGEVIPENTLKKTKSVTLAYGESTGHHHSILDGGAVGFAEDENDLSSFLRVVEEKAALTHQEHETITLPKGDYERVDQYEYTPKALQRVID
jgi:hypothetical protein